MYENYRHDQVAVQMMEELGLLERARDEAAREAEVTLPRERQEREVKKKLKTAKHGSLKKVKEHLEMARKPKMRTVQHYLCDQCDNTIPSPSESDEPKGFVVHGNILVADPNNKGGLIGNNFPEVKEGEKIEPEAVKQTVLCTGCFLAALGILPAVNPYSSPKNAKKYNGVLSGPEVARELNTALTRHPRNNRNWGGAVSMESRAMSRGESEAMYPRPYSEGVEGEMSAPRQYIPGHEGEDSGPYTAAQYAGERAAQSARRRDLGTSHPASETTRLENFLPGMMSQTERLL